MADFTEQLSGATGREEARLDQQDMNSYLYLLMEDMLFATAEGLCRKQGNMADVVAGYLVEFYKREMAGTRER